MKRQPIYWDSVAFLGLINEESDKLQDCEEVWREARDGRFVIVTSTLTVAEVIYMKGTPKLDPSKRDKVSNFFRQSHIALRPVTRIIAEAARDVVWDHGIHPKDAIHVATAAIARVSTVHTLDIGLLKKKELEIDGFKVLISRPQGSGQLAFPELTAEAKRVAKS